MSSRSSQPRASHVREAAADDPSPSSKSPLVAQVFPAETPDTVGQKRATAVPLSAGSRVRSGQARRSAMAEEKTSSRVQPSLGFASHACLHQEATRISAPAKPGSKPRDDTDPRRRGPERQGDGGEAQVGSAGSSCASRSWGWQTPVPRRERGRRPAVPNLSGTRAQGSCENLVPDALRRS